MPACTRVDNAVLGYRGKFTAEGKPAWFPHFNPAGEQRDMNITGAQPNPSSPGASCYRRTDNVPPTTTTTTTTATSSTTFTTTTTTETATTTTTTVTATTSPTSTATNTSTTTLGKCHGGPAAPQCPRGPKHGATVPPVNGGPAGATGPRAH